MLLGVLDHLRQLLVQVARRVVAPLLAAARRAALVRTRQVGQPGQRLLQFQGGGSCRS
jgi:hypothetical protein